MGALITFLAYGTIFMRATFRPKIKLDVFFSARKAIDERCLGGGASSTHPHFGKSG